MKLPEKTKALFTQINTVAMATGSSDGVPNGAPMAR